MPDRWILYGAYGYTGRLIAATAVELGLVPTIAGRDAAKVAAMAKPLGLPFATFDVDDPVAAAAALRGAKLVLNCAGPFADTGRRMATAAIQAGCHYLDIAGEVAVFEAIQELGPAAAQAGVMLMPGVGFDVVPTDCVAVALKQALPDATSLELAFIGPNKAAAGSIKTALRALPEGSLVRAGGQLQRLPHFRRRRIIRVDGHRYTAHAIPWGDLATAFRSTGIGDIAVYTVFPKAQVLALSALQPLLRQLRHPRLLRIAEAAVDLAVRAPAPDYLQTGRFVVWGQVRNRRGERRTRALRTGDTYTVTRHSAVHIVQQVLSGRLNPGYQTPAMVYGATLIDAVPDTEHLRVRDE